MAGRRSLSGPGTRFLDVGGLRREGSRGRGEARGRKRGPVVRPRPSRQTHPTGSAAYAASGNGATAFRQASVRPREGKRVGTPKSTKEVQNKRGFRRSQAGLSGQIEFGVIPAKNRCFPRRNADFEVMEAGGIEPPSRDVADDASTCIVDRLNLGSVNAGRQASSDPSPMFSHGVAFGRHDTASPLSSLCEVAGVPSTAGYLFLGSHGIRVVAM